MQAHSPVVKDLLLLGGGHTHVLVLRMLAMRILPGVRITLISPSSHTPYSGMLPGLVAGHYRFEEAHIDLARLCQWAGARFIQAEATGVDKVEQRVVLAGRPDVDFDLLSIDIGSQPELDSVPGARHWAVPVKPVAALWQRMWSLDTAVANNAHTGPFRIGLVGGGAGSVELALAIAVRFASASASASASVAIDLYCGAGEILSGYNPRARRSVERALAAHGIALHRNARVTAVEQGLLILADQSRHSFDELFWCTGAAAAPWLAETGLVTDQNGFLIIEDTLALRGCDNIFAAGDTATQVRNPRPKAGVFAVRQAPVLAANLAGYLSGSALQQHRPQQRFLSLISLGGKTATADRGPFNATGSWVWRWKDRIDRKFMAQFSELLPLQNTMSRPSGQPGNEPLEQAPCGGCGAKVAASTLSQVLGELAIDFPKHCVNGAQAEDAAIISPVAGATLVQSIDVLREMVADPWLMGRIAANHALSDLYACGAKPLSALATVSLPFAPENIQRRELKLLLAGVLYELAAVDCKLLGGHSLQGAELNIGLVVNGAVSEKILSKRGLHEGDQLVLTKPLGTGTLFAAHMQGLADGRHITVAIENMLQSNLAAGILALTHGASAMTDVTGFGLAGHLLEMLLPDQGAVLDLKRIPALAGAKDGIARAVLSTAHEANAAARAELNVVPANVDAAAVELLFDPQTSGGLLLGIAPQRCAALINALQEAGYKDVAVIGEVSASAEKQSARLSLRQQ